MQSNLWHCLLLDNNYTTYSLFFASKDTTLYFIFSEVLLLRPERYKGVREKEGLCVRADGPALIGSHDLGGWHLNRKILQFLTPFLGGIVQFPSLLLTVSINGPFTQPQNALRAFMSVGSHCEPRGRKDSQLTLSAQVSLQQSEKLLFFSLSFHLSSLVDLCVCTWVHNGFDYSFLG